MFGCLECLCNGLSSALGIDLMNLNSDPSTEEELVPLIDQHISEEDCELERIAKAKEDSRLAYIEAIQQSMLDDAYKRGSKAKNLFNQSVKLSGHHDTNTNKKDDHPNPNPRNSTNPDNDEMTTSESEWMKELRKKDPTHSALVVGSLNHMLYNDKIEKEKIDQKYAAVEAVEAVETQEIQAAKEENEVGKVAEIEKVEVAKATKIKEAQIAAEEKFAMEWKYKMDIKKREKNKEHLDVTTCTVETEILQEEQQQPEPVVEVASDGNWRDAGNATPKQHSMAGETEREDRYEEVLALPEKVQWPPPVAIEIQKETCMKRKDTLLSAQLTPMLPFATATAPMNDSTTVRHRRGTINAAINIPLVASSPILPVLTYEAQRLENERAHNECSKILKQVRREEKQALPQQDATEISHTPYYQSLLIQEEKEAAEAKLKRKIKAHQRGTRKMKPPNDAPPPSGVQALIGLQNKDYV